jgi:hypothetical protein
LDRDPDYCSNGKHSKRFPSKTWFDEKKEGHLYALAAREYGGNAQVAAALGRRGEGLQTDSVTEEEYIALVQEWVSKYGTESQMPKGRELKEASEDSTDYNKRHLSKRLLALVGKHGEEEHLVCEALLIILTEVACCPVFQHGRGGVFGPLGQSISSPESSQVGHSLQVGHSANPTFRLNLSLIGGGEHAVRIQFCQVLKQRSYVRH